MARKKATTPEAPKMGEENNEQQEMEQQTPTSIDQQNDTPEAPKMGEEWDALEQANIELAQVIALVENANTGIKKLITHRSEGGMAVTRLRKISDELHGILKTLRLYA